MKRNTARFLLVLLMMLSLCFLCTSCGGDAGSVESTKGSTIPSQDNPSESTGGDVPGLSEDDYNIYVGIWLRDANDQSDFIDIDAEGDWRLYSNGDMIDEGYLWYEPEEDVTYIYTYQDSDIDDGYVDLDGDRLNISTLGSFHYLTQSILEFQGIWYLDEDLSADAYIEIDSDGYWYYNQRTPDDPEGTIIDCGTLAYSMEQADLYYANPMYNDTSYLVLNFDAGILIWGDEGAYYRMEDLQ